MKKITFFVVVLISIAVQSQNLQANKTGMFTFTPSGALSTKPINVFYHIPNGDITTMPILFSFHGGGRNADNYRDYWITMANANNFMVFAPEFSNANFPGGDGYNLANIFDDGDNPSLSTLNPKDEWAFSVIDPLFEQIRAAVSGTQEKYNAWGHSAGAQFLHRFVMYLPNSKLDIAVCSNSGWYTVPEFSIDFPYALDKSQLPNVDLIAAFSKKLIVHIGTSDTDPNSAGLRHNSTVDNQQGVNRYVRGNYFFSTSQTTAQQLNATFTWEKDEVANVGHNGQLMANDALEHVLKSTLASSNYQINKISIYPNPAKDFLFFDNAKLKSSKVEIYSVLGKLIQTFHFNDFSKKQKITISNLEAGIYFLSIKNSKIKFLKP